MENRSRTTEQELVSLGLEVAAFLRERAIDNYQALAALEIADVIIQVRPVAATSEQDVSVAQSAP